MEHATAAAPPQHTSTTTRKKRRIRLDKEPISPPVVQVIECKENGSIELLMTEPSSQLSIPEEPVYYIKESKIHGKGLFAARILQPKQLIGYYTGKILNVSQMMAAIRRDESTDYWIEIGSNFVIDGSEMENRMRYMNHAKPGSKEMNCRAEQDTDGRIRMVTIRRVEKEEELLFDYKGCNPESDPR